jgi:hypothetical protein
LLRSDLTRGGIEDPSEVLAKVVRATGGAAQVSFAYGSGAADALPLVWR